MSLIAVRGTKQNPQIWEFFFGKIYCPSHSLWLIASESPVVSRRELAWKTQHNIHMAVLLFREWVGKCVVNSSGFYSDSID